MTEQAKLPVNAFQNNYYQRHNQRRLEHLASLRLSMSEMTVLEVGAGIGDHTQFFLDRNCQVTSIEARANNLAILQDRFPQVRSILMDLDDASKGSHLSESFDIVYCYGLLYHLAKPAEGLQWMSHHCRNLFLLETCVQVGEKAEINPCKEYIDNPTQSFSGNGCRPTRSWIYGQLKQHFEFVYLPKTQPNHEQFPLDWTVAPPENCLTRSIFIGSRTPLSDAMLVQDLPMHQTRH